MGDVGERDCWFLGDVCMICYAEKLADYVARTRFEDLPETVVAHAKWCVLDSIGVGLASRLKPWAVAALNVADALGGTPESTVWGGGATHSAIGRAWGRER